MLDLADEASQDLRNLIELIPSSRRPDAINAVEAALELLAANPRLAQPQYLGRPTYHFGFKADGVEYHWGCTFVFSEDEERICVTHLFRVPL